VVNLSWNSGQRVELALASAIEPGRELGSGEAEDGAVGVFTIADLDAIVASA
jgi:hypothetical protein